MHSLLQSIRKTWKRTPLYMKSAVIVLVVVLVGSYMISQQLWDSRRTLEYVGLLVLYSLIVELFSIDQAESFHRSSVTEAQLLFLLAAVSSTVLGVFFQQVLDTYFGITLVQLIGLIVFLTRGYAWYMNVGSPHMTPPTKASSPSNTEYATTGGCIAFSVIALASPLITSWIESLYWDSFTSFDYLWVSLAIAVLVGVIVFIALKDNSKQFLESILKP